ncbi:MAG: SDR family oxidoreductase [Anaerolineae bacterium]
MANTALITGASSGIGAAYARALATRGHDLILVARRADRLAALAAQIEADHPVRAESLPADLADRAGLERVAAHIEAEPGGLALLINNAGFGVAGPFEVGDPAAQTALLDVHVIAATRLARAALPGMLARGGGGIVNVSSIAGLLTIGGSPLYNASKAYLNSFSANLSADLQGSGIRVQALCPGFTLTEFHAEVRHGDGQRPPLPAWLWMTPEEVVAASLRALGRGRPVIVVPGWPYKLVATLLRLGMGPLVRTLRRTVRGRLPQEGR